MVLIAEKISAKRRSLIESTKGDFIFLWRSLACPDGHLVIQALTHPHEHAKNAPKGRFRVLVEVVGGVPLAETPRSAIINCRFCLTRKALSYFRKAKRSLPLAAPTLNSDHDDLYRQTKNTPREGYFCLWWRWSELNRRLTRLPKNFLHT